MRRTISSSLTFIYKCVFPTVWIGLFASGTLSILLQPDTSPHALAGAFLVATILGSVFLYFFCVRLKSVELDGNTLHISNYLRTISVPLMQVEDVTENVWVNIHPVALHFSPPSDFGRTVVFMPTIRIFAFMSSHPIVGELRAAVAQAK